MKVQIKKINPVVSYSKDAEDKLKVVMATYCEKRRLYMISTQTIGKPHRAIYINGPETKLLLMNPAAKEYSKEIINSSEISEFDDKPGKTRTVRRALSVTVTTDNLGDVLFEGNPTDNRVGLDECILVQQLLDLLDGITIQSRNINRPIESAVKHDRNQLVLARSPKGVIEQVKYKKVESLIAQGYVIL